MGRGKALESLSTNNASSSMEPRATVFSMGWRSERPSAKKLVGESVFWRGWLAISWRRVWLQPANELAPRTARRTARSEELVFIPDLADVLRGHALQEPGRFRQIEFRIARFDTQEEAVRGCVREAFHVEDRVIRLRELVQGQHAHHGEDGSAENGEFKSDGNERRPAIQRPAADIHGIGNRSNPVLQTKAGQAAAQADNQSDQGHRGPAKTNNMREAFHREGCVGSDVLVARHARLLRGAQDLLRRRELAHHAIELCAVFLHLGSPPERDSCATSSRISAMAMAGKPRTNRKISMTKRPRVPMKVLKSQKVGW